VAYDQRPWPTSAERDAKVEWLRRDRQPFDTPGTGTYLEARIAVRFAISGALSILLEVPIEHEADEAALLQTLVLTRWAVPRHQRKRVARRFARYIENSINCESFVPVEAGACA
jgi:hypothetical protein